MPSRAPKQHRAQEPLSSSFTRTSEATSRATHHVHPLLHLQQTVGNQTVVRMLDHAPQSAAFLPPGVADVLASPGHSLNQATRRVMEPRFGHDFGQVRVHADAKAGESAAAIDARAYTVGHDIVLGSGEPGHRPESPRSAEFPEILYCVGRVTRPHVRTSDGHRLKIDRSASSSRAY